MSFENTQLLKTGDKVTVFTQPSGQVIRLEICDEHDDLAYTTLNVEELGALIQTLMVKVYGLKVMLFQQLALKKLTFDRTLKTRGN